MPWHLQLKQKPCSASSILKTCHVLPLIFERNDTQYQKFMCCQACLATTLTYGFTVCIVPIAACCPYKYADQFSLRLDKDALTFQAAGNDCCW